MSSTRGVAIIIVLGMLALLMVLGVAFSVSMRVERSAAGNYADSVFARHLMWSAIARAVVDIDTSMSSGGVQMYPVWANDMLVSQDQGSNAVLLGWGEAIGYLPDHLIERVRTTPAYWIDVTVAAERGIHGRCAYIVVNDSGLLDANFVGGTGRGAGVNPQEIQIDRLWDVNSTDDFVTARADDVRYENLPDLIATNYGLRGVSNLTTYSLAPVQKYWDASAQTLKQRVWVGGTADELATNQAAIAQGFRDSGLRNDGIRDAVGTAFTNLLDYVDADSIPRSLSVGSTEMVPMINEVAVEYRLAPAGVGRTNVICGVSVEWAYPFDVPSAASLPFSVDWTITFTGGTPVQMGVGGTSTHPELMPDPITPPAGSIAVAALARNSYGSITRGGNKFITSLSPGTPAVHFTVEVKARIKQGSDVVDAVPAAYPSGTGVKVYVDIPSVPDGQMITTTNWSECIDPRFNWAPAGGATYRQWVNNREINQLVAIGWMPASFRGRTLGSANNIAKFTLMTNSLVQVNFDGSTVQEVTSLYVANRPLVSVGELGNICTRPWQSIRLYDHAVPAAYRLGADDPVHRVLDVFTVHPPTVTTRRGLVNPNTLHREVLAAAFYQAPEKEYSPADAMGWDTALQVADLVIANGPYTNLSDIGYAITNWGSYVTGVSEIAKESAIRNSCELMSVRQNLFTILMAAGAAAEGMGIAAGTAADWLSYNRGVAVVWRDPFPIPGTGNARHWWFVRHYKQLGE